MRAPPLDGHEEAQPLVYCRDRGVILEYRGTGSRLDRLRGSPQSSGMPDSTSGKAVTASRRVPYSPSNCATARLRHRRRCEECLWRACVVCPGLRFRTDSCLTLILKCYWCTKRRATNSKTGKEKSKECRTFKTVWTARISSSRSIRICNKNFFDHF